MSHPVWVRGLKLAPATTYNNESTSHPVWVRGLKLYIVHDYECIKSGRTPCGCVD